MKPSSCSGGDELSRPLFVDLILAKIILQTVVDSYPLGFNPSNPNQWSQVPDFTVNQKFLQNSPLFSPEFGGGTTDVWGGPGYLNCYELTNPSYESVFYKSLVGQGLTMMNFYMTYGGTSWGWLPYSGRADSFITAVYKAQ